MARRLPMLAIPLVLALAPAAHASTVTIEPRSSNSPVLKYVAAAGEANALTLTQSGSFEDGTLAYTLTDPGAVIEPQPGTGCAVDGDPHRVVCQDVAVFELEAALGDRDDSLTVDASPIATAILGGDGNDLLRGNPAPRAAAFAVEAGEDSSASEWNYIEGGPGDDTIIGGADWDRLWGGPGNDTMEAGAGFDALCGGDRQERDQTSSYCRSYDGDGNDVLDAGRFDDLLYAGGGDDRLVGGPGTDYLLGGPGNDVIDATGDDPGPAPGQPGFNPWDVDRDQINGDDGADVIATTDGAADQISCGAGPDVVTRDQADTVLGFPAGVPGYPAECELVTPALPLPPFVTLAPVLNLLPNGSLDLGLTCPPAGALPRDCRGSLVVHVQPAAGPARTGGRISLGRRRFRVRTGRALRVRFRAAPGARRRLRALARRGATVSVVVRDARGRRHRVQAPRLTVGR